MRTSAPGARLAIALVAAACLYTAALCLINTRVAGVSNTIVALVDGAILLVALAAAMHGASRWLWVMLAALATNFLLLAILSGDIELKAIRDPLVLITFAALGWRYGAHAQARNALLSIGAVVIAFGLFEFLAPTAFTDLFNVINFYAARGVVDIDATQRPDSSFFISGTRDGDRMLFPFLGTHRVSSIFLEPVSMGNFGAIALAFALAQDRANWRTALGAGLVGVVAIVLADARFGSTAAILFILARLLPAKWACIGLPLLPLIAIGVLLLVAAAIPGSGDDLPTRLAGSGRVLLNMGAGAVFGISQYEITTYDAGYAYILSAFGLPFCVALWAAFVLLPASTPEARRFKLLMGVYACALLCVSGSSLFAMKTAALAFFMLGALASPRAAPAAQPRELRLVRVQAAPA